MGEVPSECEAERVEFQIFSSSPMREHERRAFAKLARDVDGDVVAPRYFARDGEPEPCPHAVGVRRSFMEFVKYVRQS